MLKVQVYVEEEGEEARPASKTSNSGLGPGTRL